jgi:hypothetical protein
MLSEGGVLRCIRVHSLQICNSRNGRWLAAVPANIILGDVFWVQQRTISLVNFVLLLLLLFSYYQLQQL